MVYQPVLFVLVITYVLIVILSILELFFFRDRITVPISVAGLLLLSFGIILRDKAILELGEEWSLGIKIRLRQRLVTTGIYKRLRHPYYIAVLLELWGVCLLANAYLTAILVAICQLPVLVLRIYYEERLLLKKFGQAYESYRKQTW